MSLMPLVVDGKVMRRRLRRRVRNSRFHRSIRSKDGKEILADLHDPGAGRARQRKPGPRAAINGKPAASPYGSPGNYDPDTNTAYWGTGNGGPWMGDQRPGDNLYTASTIALDGATGKIRSTSQYHPNDSWDWDEVSPPILVDFQRNGRHHQGSDRRRARRLPVAARTWRRQDRVRRRPAIRKPQCVHAASTPGPAAPIVDPAHKPGTGETASFCPSVWGGKDWPPAAYSPKTRLLYIPANENLCTELTSVVPKYVPGERYTGTSKSVLLMVAGADHIGELQAWDLDSGKRAWTTKLPSQNWGPVLATGGDLLFSGGTNDRLFRAFDAKTGDILWQYPTLSGVNGVPVSFAVDGTQYIAVQSGWGVDAARMQRGLNLLFPGKYPDVPQGGAVYVFAVK